MKIILDPQAFNMQTYGGITRHYVEVFSRLYNYKGLKIILPINESKNVYLNNSKLLNSSKKFNFSKALIKFLNSIGISTRTLNRRITENLLEDSFKKIKFDLFIPTYYNPYFLDFLQNKPFVLTVYDMIHELYPEYFIGDPFNVSVNKKILLEKATKIIAVSNNTKKDIIKIYPQIDESKIEVIYHGNSIQVNENVQVDLPDNYILFVGSRDNYKNFIFLVEALKDLLMFDSSLKIVCAGGGSFKEDEILFLKILGLENQVEQRYFEEDELGLFYKKAKCFVFPSEYEGFGIPILESMACGCPIVLSNSSSFPEVAGDAGIFFEINNMQDLRDKVSLVLNNEQLRSDYIKKGMDRVKQFNWDEVALKCAVLYKNVLK